VAFLIPHGHRYCTVSAIVELTPPVPEIVTVYLRGDAGVMLLLLQSLQHYSIRKYHVEAIV
jgi:hypothetical protein